MASRGAVFVRFSFNIEQLANRVGLMTLCRVYVYASWQTALYRGTGKVTALLVIGALRETAANMISMYVNVENEA